MVGTPEFQAPGAEVSPQNQVQTKKSEKSEKSEIECVTLFRTSTVELEKVEERFDKLVRELLKEYVSDC